MLLHKSMESQKHKWELGKKWEHKSTGASDSKKIRCHKSVLCTKREELILPVKTRVWYRMHESELENGLYHAGNARAHASYILSSTTRKST